MDRKNPSPLENMRMLDSALESGAAHARSIQGAHPADRSALPLPGRGVRLGTLLVILLHLACLIASAHCLHLRGMPDAVPVTGDITRIGPAYAYLDIDEEASRVRPGEGVIGQANRGDLPPGARVGDRITLYADPREAYRATDSQILTLLPADVGAARARLEGSCVLAWSLLLLCDAVILIRRRRERAAAPSVR